MKHWSALQVYDSTEVDGVFWAPSAPALKAAFLGLKAAALGRFPVLSFGSGIWYTFRPTMFWITGDKHGDFASVDAFCRAWQTRRRDVLIVLGDAGINYFDDARSTALKQHLAQLPITLFCIHGNHEARAEKCPGYERIGAFGGEVYADPHYPNQLFAIDGTLYQLGVQRVLAIGGAYSVDKFFRLRHHWRWFEDEQPDAAIRARTEATLAAAGWKVDAVLSHTCPLSVMPRKRLAPPAEDGFSPPVDTSTEEWLESLRARLTFRQWYAGHFHLDRISGAFAFLYDEFLVFDA